MVEQAPASAHGSAAPVRRPGGRSARVRKAVLTATLEELADAGYGGLSMGSIARRAGVHKTTVYRRWPTRELLIEDALVERSDALTPLPDTGSLREDLVRFGLSMIASISDPQYRAIIRAVAADPDGGGPLSVAARRFWEDRLTQAQQLVQRGIDRGHLPPTTDPIVMIEALVGPLYFRLLITRQPLEPRFVELLVDQLLDPERSPPADGQLPGSTLI